MRRTPLLAAAAVVLLFGAACGGASEPDEDETRQDVIDQLHDGGEGFSEEATECFADILIDEIGIEELQDVDLTSSDPPEGLDDEVATASLRAVDECDLTGTPE